MATITATCGHGIAMDWAKQGAVFIKDYSREGERAISYRVLCPECLATHEKAKLVLHNESEKQKWLGKRRKQNARLVRDNKAFA